MKRGTHVTEPEIPRQGRVERNTKETQIVLQLDIDGAGASKVETGIPFFSHMLEAWAKHGLMDLTVDAKEVVRANRRDPLRALDELPA